MRAGTHVYTRGLAGLLAFASVVAFSPPGTARAAGAAGRVAGLSGAGATRLVRLASTPRPAELQGAQLIGATPAGKLLDLEVTLRVPDAGALARFVAEVNDRNSPLFGRFLPPGAFGARFGPSLRQVGVVLAALRRAGLRPGPVAGNRLSIPVRAPVGAVERALRTTIETYRLPGGREVFANASAPALPAQAAGIVEGVLGLDDIGQVHSRLMHLPTVARRGQPASVAPSSADSPGPQPCQQATAAAKAYEVETSNVLAQHYGLTPLYGRGDLGAGVHVGVVEFEPHATSDIAMYESCYGITTKVNTFSVDGGPTAGPGSGEAALDIEDIASLAPAVTIDVYNAPEAGSDAEVEAEYGAIVSADRDQVISTSWGECELDSHTALLASEQSLFAQAAAQGQTVLAAAGDYGSTDCYNPAFPQPNPTKVSADDPGSQQNVVSVGGTTLQSHDAVWNESSVGDGATGGAVSTKHCMPAYQDQPKIAGLVNPRSKTGCGQTHSAYFRQTPDVVGDADPLTGLVIYFADQGGWMPIGGTSMTAPLWAAIAALVDASPYCSFYGSGNAGTRPTGLYAIAASGFYANAFTDVTSGGNDYTPSTYTGGLYPSTRGYDMASGLGYPNVVRYSSGSSLAPNFFSPGLAALMCHHYARKNLSAAISAMSSGTVASNGDIPVLIEGHGFLPLPGAERIIVGGAVSNQISCKTSSECTATLPPSARSGTTEIAVVVEAFTRTPQFAYKYTPEGYWLAASNGGVFAVGSARVLGGVTVTGSAPLVGIASLPDGSGYWLVSANGSVYAKGAAHWAGSLPGHGVRVDDIVALAATADGRGYWMIGRDGGEFAFGDARYHGSLPGLGIHVDDIVGMVATSDGGGYWLVGADGGVFAFGDASFKGSLPRDGIQVRDIRAMIASPRRTGYMLVGTDGGTFAFGTGVRYFGSLPARGIHVDDISGLALTADAGGYWLAASDAAVYAFGDAFAFPMPGSARSDLPIVAIAAS